MDAKDALRLLHERLPAYSRSGPSALKRGLRNVRTLCRYFGDPQGAYPTLHVAGTNGKGTVASSLASILCVAGYRVGLYTSPHLKNFSERIQINGKEIPPEAIVHFVTAARATAEVWQCSFFELTVAMAFKHFADASVDIAVIETGLGGRWDSTNIIAPLLSIITSISLDHQEVLGDTLPQIAYEKAGIIKPDTPLLLGDVLPELHPLFRRHAEQNKAPIFFSHGYNIQDHRRALFERLVRVYAPDGTLLHRALSLPIPTDYYVRNLPTILQAAASLQTLGYRVSSSSCSLGIERLFHHVSLKGRWQRLSEHPTVFCDIAHNTAALKVTLQQILHFHRGRLCIVFGLSAPSKMNPALWEILPSSARYFFAQARAFRSVSARRLHKEACVHGLSGCVVEDVNVAVARAKAACGPQGLVFVCGSAYLVAEIEGL